MGFYKLVKQTFEAERKERSPLYKSRLVRWRKEAVVERVSRVPRPTNIARARELGYKAKQGFVVARVRISKGRRKRPKPDLGRKPSKAGRFFSPEKSLQRIAEEKAATKFPNLEVLNSYWVGEDGSCKYFEVLMVDVNHAVIKNDRSVSWVRMQRGRAYRGLTSAGKKGRNL
jgi:large subunit ribosomal protein L15e